MNRFNTSFDDSSVPDMIRSPSQKSNDSGFGSSHNDSDGLEEERSINYQNGCGLPENNKHVKKLLHLKGHANEAYIKDMKVFRSVLWKENSNLVRLGVSEEDCCSVTKASTITALTDFHLNDLHKCNKDDFLRNFPITGIPVFSPLRDSSMINPWIYSIRRTVKFPYIIVNHVVLENYDKYDQNKGVYLEENDKETYFNAIIPVFSPYVASQMREIMKTHIYTMCCTNAILRNPNIIDYDIHMAALGILWVRMLYENPEQPRPEYINDLIRCIEATAAQYSEKPSFFKFRELLKNKTNQALMTEGTVKIDERTVKVKCQSIVKPMFILHLAVQAKIITDNENIKMIVRTILIEFIGRCISYKIQQNNVISTKKRKHCDNNARQNVNSSTKKTKLIANKKKICSSFFKVIYDQNNVDKYLEETQAKMNGNSFGIFQKFYHIDQCKKAAKLAVREVIKKNCFEISNGFILKVDEHMVNQLSNISSCGDVTWSTLRIFSKEIGLSDFDVEELFSEQNIFRYVAHALEYTNSKERLEIPLLEYDTCVDEKTRKERSKEVIHELFENLVEKIVHSWQHIYSDVHADVVEPMTKSQIIQEARSINIDVSIETFDDVYKRYCPSKGLLGNACQSRNCPWFLQPKRDYSAHAASEKQHHDFPYGLHIATRHHCNSDVRTIKNKIVSWELRKPKRTILQGTTHERLTNLDIDNLKRTYMQMKEQVT